MCEAELVFLLINLFSLYFKQAGPEPAQTQQVCVQTDRASPAESQVLPAVFLGCLYPAVLGVHAGTLSPGIRQYAGTILALSD